MKILLMLMSIKNTFYNIFISLYKRFKSCRPLIIILILIHWTMHYYNYIFILLLGMF